MTVWNIKISDVDGNQFISVKLSCCQNCGNSWMCLFILSRFQLLCTQCNAFSSGLITNVVRNTSVSFFTCALIFINLINTRILKKIQFLTFQTINFFIQHSNSIQNQFYFETETKSFPLQIHSSTLPYGNPHDRVHSFWAFTSQRSLKSELFHITLGKM